MKEIPLTKAQYLELKTGQEALIAYKYEHQTQTSLLEWCALNRRKTQ
jgi:hypothetical protein